MVSLPSPRKKGTTIAERAAVVSSISAIAVFPPASSSPSKAGLSGYVSFFQSSPSAKVRVTVYLRSFPAHRRFACHIHEFGDLSQGCTSACTHFNPYHKRHGSFVRHGPDRHVGDLAIPPDGNLRSDSQGTVRVTFDDDLISLVPGHVANIIGRMVVIHETQDDGGEFRDLPTKHGRESGSTGNAGARIACAVIGIRSPTTPMRR